MTSESLTGTESFRMRAQRGEQGRMAIMVVMFLAVLTMIVLRRATGGTTVSGTATFIPMICVMAAGILFESIAFFTVWSANRRGVLLPLWRFNANAVVELAIPVAALVIPQEYSPRGDYSALSGPSLLLLPLVILTSVLRLKPRVTLLTGIGAALAHCALSIRVIVRDDLDPHHIPVVLTYSVALLLIAIAAWFVARQVKRHVIETVEEATLRERTGQKLSLVERDLNIARDIQMGLLPSEPPNLPGFDIAGLNRPAEQTGGDFYDWQMLPDGRLLAIMADVTGHGIGPALVMAVCRAYSRASALLDPNPASLLARLNALLYADLQQGRFITLAMAMTSADGRLDLISAGHGPTLLWRAKERRIEQFAGDGIPLAITPDEQYGPVRELVLEPGDVLVMLTDGVFEWPDHNRRQFGIERIADLLSRVADQSSTQIIEEINSAVTTFVAGAPQVDDFTILALKRLATSTT
ncbi:MAG: PP2C family protein-serine/threonine phosphatase [Phycisphaerales bacterium]|nr:PP2C family protein-serine/threonine phosphatase [Phycisphaerales bacterium]